MHDTMTMTDASSFSISFDDLKTRKESYPERERERALVSKENASSGPSISQAITRIGTKLDLAKNILDNRLVYDSEIKYIESNVNNGTAQYIDTLAPVTPQTKVKVAWMQISRLANMRVFGLYDGGNANFQLFINGSVQLAYVAGGNVKNISAWPNNRVSTGVFSLADGSYAITDNYGGTFSGTVTGTPFSSYNTLPIFARKNFGVIAYADYPAWIRLYSFQMWDGETLVRDFIPVRVGSVGYLHDRVSGILFGNLGTGAFVLGPDKTEV